MKIQFDNHPIAIRSYEDPVQQLSELGYTCTLSCNPSISTASKQAAFIATDMLSGVDAQIMESMHSCREAHRSCFCCRCCVQCV